MNQPADHTKAMANHADAPVAGWREWRSSWIYPGARIALISEPTFGPPAILDVTVDKVATKSFTVIGARLPMRIDLVSLAQQGKRRSPWIAHPVDAPAVQRARAQIGDSRIRAAAMMAVDAWDKGYGRDDPVLTEAAIAALAAHLAVLRRNAR